MWNKKNNQDIETLYLSEYSDYLHTQEMGALARTEIAGYWEGSRYIICNFDDVHGMTGVFADEAFGVMFMEKGSKEFVEKIRFQNLNDLIQAILKSTLYERYERMRGRGDWENPGF